jgi:hypothetical protein
MLPENLNASQFTKYPPQARAFATDHLALLRQLPLAFLPSLLREVIEYDYTFPVERTQIDRQLGYLQSLSPGELQQCFAAFAQLRLSAEQTSFDWSGRPLDFTEQLAAYLWRTHQMNAFRDAALAYGTRLEQALPPLALPTARLGMAVVGQGAAPHQPGLFLKLREHGTLFTDVDPANGLASMLAVVQARAKNSPGPYAHWYVDGGFPLDHSEAITGVSYGSLAPVRAALFAQIQKQVNKPGMGPEELRDFMSHLSPADLGMRGDSLAASLLDRFQIKVLTEGSGTQIFSTTYAQWTAREALRRAEPLTLLVRFQPRQRQRPMNELLAGDEGTPQLDPEGSLVDADMASYYHWINQQRLPGAQQASFVVWFEGQRQALVVSPGLPRNTVSDSPLTVPALLALVTG